MKELVVISGKGGTGKTSIVSSFAALANPAVLADCDVDAADLHLILDPTVVREENFSGGNRAEILQDRCTACGLCHELCRFDAIIPNASANGNPTYRVDPIACEGCGVCAHFCPEQAIDFSPAVNGKWFVSDTRFGPMVHAKLGIAEENSGKLVAHVRTHAKQIAQEKQMDLILIDGPPGTGCPVIASITGADLILAVTEPTLSGLHDLNRIFKLARHFDIPMLVCVNKWDLNPEITEKIELQARNNQVGVCGRIRYDRSVTEAQLKVQSVIEHGNSPAAEDIMKVWEKVSGKIRQN